MSLILLRRVFARLVVRVGVLTLRICVSGVLIILIEKMVMYGGIYYGRI